MGIPIYRASRQSAGQTSLQKVNPHALASTGEAEAILSASRHVAGALQDTSDYALMVQDAEDRTALSTAERQRDERIYNALDEVEKTSDVSKHKQIIDAAKADINTYSPQSRWVANAYKQSNDYRMPIFAKKFEQVSDSIRNRNIEADNELNWERAIEHGEYEKLENIAADNMTNMIWAKGDAAKFLQDGRRQIEVNAAREKIYEDPGAAVKLLSGKEAKETFKNLSGKDRIALVREAETRQAYNKRIAAEQLEVQQETDRDIIFDAINGKLLNEDGSERLLNYEDVENTSLDEHEQQSMWNMLQKVYSGADELKYKNSDPKIRMMISERIHTGKPLTKKEIWEYAGKGLSTDHAEKYSRELESRDGGETNPVVSMRKKMGSGKLKKVFEGQGLWGEDESKESIEMYQRRLNQWETFWEKNPEASDKEADEFMGLLTSDIYNQFTNNYNKDYMREIESGIAEKLTDFAIAGDGDMFVLDNEPNDLDGEDGDTIKLGGARYAVGESFEHKGVKYKYIGNGKLEY